MSESRAVLAAISGVTADLSKDGIGKDRKNAQQGYNFRGIDDVLNAISALYAKHKLVVLPKYSERTVVERETKSGGALFVVTVTGRFTLVGEDGSMIEAGPFYGEASDTADKATNKAMSACYKYFALQTFAIPVEGTPDADEQTHEVAAANRARVDDAAYANQISTIADGEAWEVAKKAIFDECKRLEDTEAWSTLKVKLAERAKAIGHTPKTKEGKSNGAAAQG